MVLSAGYANPEWKADNSGQPNKENFLRPLSADPRVYIEPTLSGGSFWSSIETLCNGEPLEHPPDVGPHHYLLQVANRTRTRKDIIVEIFGEEFPRVSREDDADHATYSEDTKACMRSLEFDAADLSRDKLLKFGWDMTWVSAVKVITRSRSVTFLSFQPFMTQSLTARGLTGVDNHEGWLPPGLPPQLPLTQDGPVGRPRLERACGTQKLLPRQPGDAGGCGSEEDQLDPEGAHAGLRRVRPLTYTARVLALALLHFQADVGEQRADGRVPAQVHVLLH